MTLARGAVVLEQAAGDHQGDDADPERIAALDGLAPRPRPKVLPDEPVDLPHRDAEAEALSDNGSGVPSAGEIENFFEIGADMHLPSILARKPKVEKWIACYVPTEYEGDSPLDLRRSDEKTRVWVDPESIVAIGVSEEKERVYLKTVAGWFLVTRFELTAKDRKDPGRWAEKRRRAK